MSLPPVWRNTKTVYSLESFKLHFTYSCFQVSCNRILGFSLGRTKIWVWALKTLTSALYIAYLQECRLLQELRAEVWSSPKPLDNSCTDRWMLCRWLPVSPWELASKCDKNNIGEISEEEEEALYICWPSTYKHQEHVDQLPHQQESNKRSQWQQNNSKSRSGDLLKEKFFSWQGSSVVSFFGDVIRTIDNVHKKTVCTRRKYDKLL